MTIQPFTPEDERKQDRKFAGGALGALAGVGLCVPAFVLPIEWALAVYIVLLFTVVGVIVAWSTYREPLN